MKIADRVPLFPRDDTVRRRNKIVAAHALKHFTQIDYKGLGHIRNGNPIAQRILHLQSSHLARCQGS